MDPNATLEEILNAIRELKDAGNSDDALDAASNALEAFENLDEWLSKGGFLPKRWER